MKQVVQSVRSGDLRLVEVPAPQIGPSEVLVATGCSLVSAGTERAVRKLASANLVEKARARPDLVRQVLRKARADRLGRLGLSAAKIKTLKSLAREIAAERLNLDVLANEDADAAHHTLTSLHGIGPWTADVYLLFCLGHGDAWPAGDLAVQEAVKIGLGLKTRPTAKQMAPLAEPWRPLRGAAAHLWWAYYRAIKKREGAIAGQPGPDAVLSTIPVAKRPARALAGKMAKSPK